MHVNTILKSIHSNEGDDENNAKIVEGDRFIMQPNRNAKDGETEDVSKCPAHTSAARSKRGWRQKSIVTKKYVQKKNVRNDI